MKKGMKIVRGFITMMDILIDDTVVKSGIPLKFTSHYKFKVTEAALLHKLKKVIMSHDILRTLNIDYSTVEFKIIDNLDLRKALDLGAFDNNYQGDHERIIKVSEFVKSLKTKYYPEYNEIDEDDDEPRNPDGSPKCEDCEAVGCDHRNADYQQPFESYDLFKTEDILIKISNKVIVPTQDVVDEINRQIIDAHHTKCNSDNKNVKIDLSVSITVK